MITLVYIDRFFNHVNESPSSPSPSDVCNFLSTRVARVVVIQESAKLIALILKNFNLVGIRKAVKYKYSLKGFCFWF